jgi:hypothetical protein
MAESGPTGDDVVLTRAVPVKKAVARSMRSFEQRGPFVRTEF